MDASFPSSLPKKQRSTQLQVRRRNPPTIRISQGLLNRAAAVVDACLMMASALVFQRFAPGDGRGLSLLQAMVVGLVSAAGLLTILVPSGGYRPERRRRAGAALFDILIGVAFAAGACRLLVWAFAPDVLHANTWLVLWTVAAVLALVTARGVAFSLGAGFINAGWLRRRTAVVGEPLAARALADALSGDRGFSLLGLFGDGVAGGHDLRALHRLAQEEGVDLIVLAVPRHGPEQLLALAGQLQWISADVIALIEDPEALKGSRLLTQVAGSPALILHRHPLKGAEGVLKLSQDYAVALAALVVAAPVMLIVALSLKIAGGGPVLFRQRRLGFNGRPFTIYKFRTMRVDPADDGSRGAVEGDPRCTRLGQLLRKTSLDELPQLFNVLRGEMSIVGPRPHVPNMQVGSGAYVEVVRAYAARHQIKPGLTGWAQINGMRGGINTLDRARAGVELDLHYIRNWSLWLDLRIILATAFRNVAGPRVF